MYSPRLCKNHFFFGCAVQIAKSYFRNAADIQTAVPYANLLRSRGELVIIAIGQKDSSPFAPLSSPGGAIAWSNTTDPSAVSHDVNHFISKLLVEASGNSRSINTHCLSTLVLY